jgi:hypothetical protein
VDDRVSGSQSAWDLAVTRSISSLFIRVDLQVVRFSTDDVIHKAKKYAQPMQAATRYSGYPPLSSSVNLLSSSVVLLAIKDNLLSIAVSNTLLAQTYQGLQRIGDL